VADGPARRAGVRISTAERRARLAVRHRLTPPSRTDDVVAIADDLVALHSSDPVTVHLSVLARMRHPALAAVERALYDDRTLVRHHAMRRTLWVAGHETVRLAHAAATVDVHRTEHRKLCAGLTAAGFADPDAWFAAGRAQVLDLLADGPLPGRDVGRRLPELTTPIPAGRLDNLLAAHTRLLLVLGFAGEVVRARPIGTWINGQYRWAAAHDWLPGGIATGLDRRAAAAGLAERWLRAFGPGTKADLQWWAGWTAATTNRALADVDAVAVELDDGSAAFVLPDDVDTAPPVEPWVALLPGLDPTTMGWKERGWYLDPEVGAAVFDRNGNAGPTIWVDGRVVGSWVQRPDGTIAVHLLTDVDPTRRAEIDATAERLRELLGDVRFRVRFPAPVQAALLA
jgi:hypothetical protein